MLFRSRLCASLRRINTSADAPSEIELELAAVTVPPSRNAGLVFVGLDREKVVAQCALIEGALEAKPMLAIVALGDGMDNQLVLNAMRAGARDFVAYGSRSSVVAQCAPTPPEAAWLTPSLLMVMSFKRLQRVQDKGCIRRKSSPHQSPGRAGPASTLPGP